jgi:phosphate starvation-inducible PhoH-like protein
MTLHAEIERPAVEVEVALPKRLAERLVTPGDAMASAIKRPLEPYPVGFALGRDGVAICGDDVAVKLAKRILEVVAEDAHAAAASPEAVSETAARVIEHAMTRDLAYRLTGVTRPLRPLTLGQHAFLELALASDKPLVVCAGPTGTGKTHLVMAIALSLLAQEKHKHVVVTRPHVVPEGQPLTPSLRSELTVDDQFLPVEDVLHDLVGRDETAPLLAHDQLRLLPVGMMRGRTFNDSLIVVDDAQNLTIAMMRMAAGRLGRNSRLFVTGDPGQSELRTDELSGLPHLLGLIKDQDFALVHRFERHQMVRNDVLLRLEELYAHAA